MKDVNQDGQEANMTNGIFFNIFKIHLILLFSAKVIFILQFMFKAICSDCISNIMYALKDGVFSMRIIIDINVSVI